MRPHWKLATGSVAMIGVSVLIGLAAPWPLAIIIDSVLGGKPLPGILQPMLGGVGKYVLLAVLVVAGLLVTALSQGLGVIDSYVNTKLNLRLTLDFRSALYAHVQRLSLAFHDQVPVGQMMFRLNQQSTAVGSIVVGMPPLAQSLITVVGMLVVALFINWQLALLSIVVLPLLIYSARFYVRRIEPRLYQVRNLEARSQTSMYEGVSMMRVILSFGREAVEHRRWREQAEAANEARIAMTVRQTIFSLVVATITATGTALITAFGAVAVLHHQLTVGELIVLLGYMAAMYSPLEQVSAQLSSLQQQFVNFNTALELLDLEPDIQDADDAVEPHRIRGEIEFEGVHFEYGRTRELMGTSRGEAQSGISATLLASGVPGYIREMLQDPAIVRLRARATDLGLNIDEFIVGRGKAALHDISFRVRAGQHVAVVGPTGAGKTTLVNLILRFYDPTQGIVRIDGVDLRRFKVTALRRQISVVLQEPMLFGGTIGDNILYGRPDASHRELVAAARAANVHDFISGLANGYDTVIGERGAQLSQGERQRISVARAFLKDAPILLLDEPTSSIDSRTESVVLAALEQLMEGRTTLTVAHRLSTIRRADLILVLDHGRLVGQGDHESLLSEHGLYAQLHDAQFGLGSEQPTPEEQRMHYRPRVLPVPALFTYLMVAAMVELVQEGSVTQFEPVLRLMPADRRIPAWWLLIGAILAAVRDGSLEPLRRLSSTQHGRPPVAWMGQLAALLLSDAALPSIHAGKAQGRSNGDQPLVDADAILAEPWAELEALYPAAAAVISQDLPRSGIGSELMQAL